MAKTFTNPFVQGFKTAQCVCTTASTDIDDAPSASVLLATAGPDGSIITRLWALPRATVAATALYLYTSDDSGTTQRFKDSALMAAYTLATTTAVPVTVFSAYSELSPMRLGPNVRLYAAISVTLAGGIVFQAEQGDF